MQTENQQSQFNHEKIFTDVLHYSSVHVKSHLEVDQENNEADISDGQPVVQNYFCQTEDHKVVKITKIIFSSQVFTLTDTISVTPFEQLKEDNKVSNICMASTTQQASSSSSENLPTSLGLSLGVKKMLKYFKRWIKQHRRQQLGNIRQLQEGCKSERQLREKMSTDKELRQSFITFANGALSALKFDKVQTRVLQRWLKLFNPLEDQYKKSDNFLNDMLILNQAAK